MSDRRSVTNGVVHYIQKHIQKGTWMPGQKLPSENELCRELGVSRVSVRNAIHQFTSLGILRSVHGKGTFLVSNDLSMFPSESEQDLTDKETIKTMRDILEFRCLIEPQICGQVAENASPALISKLEELLHDMQSAIGNRTAFVDADVNFHMEICNANANPITIRVMTDILKQRTDIAHLQNQVGGYYGGIYYHSLILMQIRKHDAKKARAVMLEHLQRGIYDLYSDSDNPEELPASILNNDYSSDGEGE